MKLVPLGAESRLCVQVNQVGRVRSLEDLTNVDTIIDFTAARLNA